VAPVQRYLDWLQRLVFEQDFGLVSVTQQPVSDELARRIPMTLKLKVLPGHSLKTVSPQALWRDSDNVTP
jgi:ABC-type dipeptide/oligopeptide/nickel transport system permease component